MKRMLNLALLAVAGFISVSGVLAQTIATANIPFNFNLQERRLPQGKYQVIQLSSGFIELRGEDGKAYAVSLALPSDRVGGAEGKLVFHRYGDQYFLSEVQTRTTDGALKVPICKAEKQARKSETSLRQHARRSLL